MAGRGAGGARRRSWCGARAARRAGRAFIARLCGRRDVQREPLQLRRVQRLLGSQRRGVRAEPLLLVELLDGVDRRAVRHHHGGDDDRWQPRYHRLRGEIEVPQPRHACQRNLASQRGRLRRCWQGCERLHGRVVVKVDERRRWLADGASHLTQPRELLITSQLHCLRTSALRRASLLRSTCPYRPLRPRGGVNPGIESDYRGDRGGRV